MTSRFVSSRQGRSFGPSRGKMGARSGARSHTVVVDDHRSMNQHATGARRGSTARPVRESEPVRSTAQTESEPPRQRDRPVRELEEKSTPSQNRTNRPCSSPFITRVCKYPDHRDRVGGATLAHWSGEKEACISPDPDICTRGSAIFP